MDKEETKNEYLRKKNAMNYLGLFKETDRLDGGDNFDCYHYHCGGAAPLPCDECYPLLFVLHGALDMRFGYGICRIEAGNLAVIDTKTLTEYRPSDDTVVLVYTPPRRLSEFLGQCNRAYEASFSQIVPILPQLSEWIDRLLEQQIGGVRPPGEAAHEQRRELARIFMSYPRNVLGELYTAFSACALGDCEKCLQGIFNSKEETAV